MPSSRELLSGFHFLNCRQLVGGKPTGWSAQTSKSSTAPPCAGPSMAPGHAQTTLSPAFFSDNDADDGGDLDGDKAVAR